MLRRQGKLGNGKLEIGKLGSKRLGSKRLRLGRLGSGWHTVLRVFQSSKKPFFRVGATFNSIYSSQVSPMQKTKDDLHPSQWVHRSHCHFIQKSMKSCFPLLSQICGCSFDFLFISLGISFFFWPRLREHLRILANDEKIDISMTISMADLK